MRIYQILIELQGVICLYNELDVDRLGIRLERPRLEFLYDSL